MAAHTTRCLVSPSSYLNLDEVSCEHLSPPRLVYRVYVTPKPETAVVLMKRSGWKPKREEWGCRTALTAADTGASGASCDVVPATRRPCRTQADRPPETHWQHGGGSEGL